MNKTLALKALAEETRLNIVKLLLKNNFCVGALARKLSLTEATISQHLKVLREAGLLIGEKRGYYMHYDVSRDALLELSGEFAALAAIEREQCTRESGVCRYDNDDCYPEDTCDDTTQEFCHGKAQKPNLR